MQDELSIPWDWRVGPSLEKIRVWVHLSVPEDASSVEAGRWLSATYRLISFEVNSSELWPKEVIAFACEVHLKDKTLRAWRVNDTATGAGA